MNKEIYRRENTYTFTLCLQLGLSREIPSDDELIKSLLSVMYLTGADYSKTFRTLSEFSMTMGQDEKTFIPRILSSCASVRSMGHIYRKRETSTAGLVNFLSYNLIPYNKRL